MQGYKIEFNVYAESQAEADQAAEAIKRFISAQAQEGRAVTAKKISEAVTRWSNNFFVKNYFK